MLKVKIERVREKESLGTDTFEIPYSEGMTVLAVLETIYRGQDPTIAYRYSCKTGMCGTCSMMINHKAGLSCAKKAEACDDGYLYLSPLPKGRTVRDLVKEATRDLQK